MIKVPTGLQDYRPGLLRRHRRRRAASRRSRCACRSTSIARELERRIVLCYTGEPRNSGTNNWEITKRHIDGDQHVFDCFERIRDTAAAMREALTRGDWDATAACLATEWENRKRLAPGVTTPAIEALIARAMAAGAQGREGLRRRRRRLPVLPRAAGRCGRGARSAGRWRRAHPRFPHRNHRPRRHARMTTPAAVAARQQGGRAHAARDRRPARAEGREPVQDSRVSQRRRRRRRTRPKRCRRSTKPALRGWNGIGKDLAGRIREIALTGDCGIRRELLTEFPATLLDVLRLQGVGPKTVAILYRELRIKSLDDLAEAAKAGRIRGIKGMGSKKEQLILQAIEERQRFAGRHLLSRATEMAEALVAYLEGARAGRRDRHRRQRAARQRKPAATSTSSPAAPTPSLADAFTRFPLVERVLANGGTKASVLLRGGFQADLRIVTPEQRGAALQYFTGSKAHNIALRDRALERGWKLNEYGLFDADDRSIAGATEAGHLHRRSAWPSSSRSCARTAARSTPPRTTRCRR